MNVIAADVGGTKTRLVYASCEQPQDIKFEACYQSAEFTGFNALLETFIEAAGSPGPATVLLALPGVVDGDEARLTNLPWQLSRTAIREHFGFEKVYFINDFQAAALGVDYMQTNDLIELNRGVHNNDAIRVIVGAGTGLGLAWLQGNRQQAMACATEGGHIDFAPVDDKQIALLQYLMRRYAHVSYERILSGNGLVALYQFCSGQAGEDIDAAWVSGAADSNEHAQQAMQMFVQIYGSYIGNLAMLFKPGGGIYIAGGIAAKILPWMQSTDFIQAYKNKGRMQALVENISVNIVSNERVGVIGALAYAMMMQKGSEQ